MKVNQIEVVNSYLKTNAISMVSRDSLLKNCTGQSSKSNWWLDLILVELKENYYYYWYVIFCCKLKEACFS